MRLLISLAVVLGFLFSCEGTKTTSPKPSPAASKAKPAVAKPSTPQGKKKVDDVFAIKSRQFDYKYNPIGKRDIFKPYEGEVTYFEEREKTPLERFDLSQLQVTAIIWGISEPRGLVHAPDGQDYIIKKDMRIGKNSGRIAKITKREVIVAEEYRDPLGKLVVKETPMVLRKKIDLDKILLELQ